MKSAILAVASLLTSAIIAQPHRHQHPHAKAAKRFDAVVWVTGYDYVTETVGVTETIWVTEGYKVPTSTSVPASTTSSSATTLATSISKADAQFFEPATLEATSSSTSTSSTSSTSTSIYVVPTPTSVYVAPTVEAAPIPRTSSTSVYVPPVVEPSSTTYVAPVIVPTTTSEAPIVTPAYVAPVESTTAPAAVATTASASSSSTGECSPGATCEGDITYYEAGLGACGWINDGSTEKVVALPHGLMGTQSNGNPYCGKTITIKTASGKTTTAKVVDKCMGCLDYSIDLSNCAFLELEDLEVGRSTATWWFN